MGKVLFTTICIDPNEQMPINCACCLTEINLHNLQMIT